MIFWKARCRYGIRIETAVNWALGRHHDDRQPPLHQSPVTDRNRLLDRSSPATIGLPLATDSAPNRYPVIAKDRLAKAQLATNQAETKVLD